MNIETLICFAILLPTTGIALLVLVVSIQRRASPGATSLIVFALSLFFGTTTHVLYLYSVSPPGLFWLRFTYLFTTIAQTALFTFALEFTNRKYLLTWLSVVLLGIEPVFFQVYLWTDKSLNLLNTTNKMGITKTILESNPWLWIDKIYSNFLILLVLVLLIQCFLKRKLQHQLESHIPLAGLLVLILASIADLTRFNFFLNFYLLPVAYSITGFTFSYIFSHSSQLFLDYVSRDIAVEKMSEGWIVLNSRNNVVDCNPAAEKALGLLRDQLCGQSIEKMPGDWQNIIKHDRKNKWMVIKKSIKMRDGLHLFNIGSSLLTGQSGDHIGQVLILRDITGHRKADESRRQSYETLLSQLRAISNAASLTLNLSDFLAASIHQLVNSFHSQSGVIFLLDDNAIESGMRRLSTTAHHGLTDQAIDSLASLESSNNLVAWILEQNEPHSISDVGSVQRVPELIKQLGCATLLSVPIMTEDQVMGVICLLRKEERFNYYEITNMATISEEIATFIRGERQRQSVIALAERQRLVRDLHDSISHNLYGVVALTEAAKAGLEARPLESQAEVLSRIGETARLAVKEMRLFLHELQPADLVQEGLVPALHQRLEAVEGRSNVKAVLITDYDGSLPLRKEVMVYYIVQEALNNVLRHSQAKSVTVKLKQKKGNVILEIEDFGCGFDPAQIGNEGMGLRNMRERATLAGGKFEVISSPGKGTRVIVAIQRGEN